MSLIQELKRRNVFKVGGAYVIIAWLLLQVSDTLVPALYLPGWFRSAVAVLLILGFPLAIFFAWAFELTPDGIRPTLYNNGSNKIGVSNFDYALLIGLFAVLSMMIYGHFSSVPPDSDSMISDQAIEKTIAVLPFADMSIDKDQEYFGDGIAEQLLNELARLDGLRVASRTSSFAFKQGQNDVQSIAKALNVRWVLEGSIRKDGDRIRITAQLINAVDGYHLWSETYDRLLDEIFAVQDEIARSVASKMGVTLGVGGINAFQGAGTRNIEAYEAYLKARKIPIFEQAPALERVILLDPDYAAAWSALAISTASTQWLSSPKDTPKIMERGYELAIKALELDPDSAESMAILGVMLRGKRDWIGSEEAHQKSLQLAASPDLYSNYGLLLMRIGRSAAARTLLDKGRSIEPMGGRPILFLWGVSVAQGRFGEAKAIAKERRGFRRSNADFAIALNEGDPEQVKITLASYSPNLSATSAPFSPVLSEFESPDRVVAILRALFEDEGAQWPSKLHDIALLAAYFGDPEFALQALAEEIRFSTIRLEAVWYPIMSEMRQLPAFKELMTELNLVASWRANGWADACHPLGEDDFECR